MKKKIHYRGRAINDVSTDLEGAGLASRWRFEQDLLDALSRRSWLEKVPSWAITCDEIVRTWRSGDDYKLVNLTYGNVVALVVVESTTESVIIHSVMGISLND